MPTYILKAIVAVTDVHGNINNESIADIWAITCPTINVSGAQDLFCLSTVDAITDLS